MLRKFAAQVYGNAVKIRNQLYSRGLLSVQNVGIPVISIGNITCGGTGKTPLAMMLTGELRKIGYRPVLLAKGYRGRIKGPHSVNGDDTFLSVGDEALLMFRRSGCPVVVSHDKTKGALHIEKENPGDIIVLDDGFQHLRLARDVNILCINAGSEKALDEFVLGRLLPAGPFREPRDPALKRADIIVISWRKMLDVSFQVPPRLMQLLPGNVPIFSSSYNLGYARSSSDGSVLPPCEAVACCSVANPEGFFESFAQLGYRLKATCAFPDHAPDLGARLEQVRREYPGLPILCTEKDVVKLAGEAARDVFFTPIEVRLSHPSNLPFSAVVINQMMGRPPLPSGACSLIGTKPGSLELEKVEIRSERLRMMPVREEHAGDIFREFTMEIAEFMLPTPPSDISDTYRFIRLCRERLSEGRDLTMSILHGETGEFLGCCGLHERNDVIHPEVGIWIKKSAHGNHFGRESVAAIRKWAETHLRYEYLIYPVDRRNTASRRIPESLGGEIFAERMEHTMWGGVLDEVVYRIPRGDRSA